MAMRRIETGIGADADRGIDHAHSGHAADMVSPAARSRRDRATMAEAARNRSSVRSPGVTRDCAVATAYARSQPTTASAEPARTIIRPRHESPSHAGWERTGEGVTD
jgi:hypothetical protein